MKKMSLFVLSALAVSSAAFAADGTAQFRILNNAIVGFSYDADMAAGTVTGQIMHDGTAEVTLSQSRNGAWTGQFGSIPVSVGSVQTDSQGNSSLEVQTARGIYDYTISTDSQGNVEIDTMSPQGDLQTAALEKNGTAFSIMTHALNMGVDADSIHPGHYEGVASGDWGSETAELDATGTLDLAALAKGNPQLFVLLYVLPFDLN